MQPHIELVLDPARMQLISGFVDVYLELNAAEEEVFQAVVDTMGLTEQEVRAISF